MAHDTPASEFERYRNHILSNTAGSLSTTVNQPRYGDIKSAPLLSWKVKQTALLQHQDPYLQYALLGHISKPDEGDGDEINPVFINTDSPWSAFICGQQGSGKSYTLSCMLEGCLLPHQNLGKLPAPLSAIVFNYDSQSSARCEAAYLCSAGIKVTVLVSPSNEGKMRKLYDELPGAKENLTVRPLYLMPADLNTERMKRLMAFGSNDSQPPLYMQVIIKTLKAMALKHQGNDVFDYDEFRDLVAAENFTREQSGPLELRLDLLESFMEGHHDVSAPQARFSKAEKAQPKSRNAKIVKTGGPEILAGQCGELKIVDLTDPVVDSDSACVLFDICLAIFLEKTDVGKVIALDEAHNYISKGAASDNFTNNILKAVREQRHKNARIIVATQEPTISPKFLDLCSMTIVHRFNSPDWWKALRSHLRGASVEAGFSQQDLYEMFDAIGNLRTGESLLFSGSAVLDVHESQIMRLGKGHKHVQTRPRISADGGMDHTATRLADVTKGIAALGV
ncbi:hypothetical protein EJ08DRAFT_597742 [Tothia fuscella]|uniref:AAA+ ATPase domain-containing protein n=1 Tax=Tothia fuscella TaxID=1048955 RepID=A0A9P4NGT9_9PEZI|nr:hypothetical protein EJ08DRAFT_597742 [Tothia fuscella]